MKTSREGRPGRRARWGERLTDPVRVIDLVQTAKTALAGGLAWWVATDLLALDQAFLAPWAAVLVVHSTVYRTVSRGSQQVAATFFAVFLAYGLGTVLGTGPVSLGLLILVGYLLGQLRWVRDEASTIATTGLVTLATGSITDVDLLASRLIDTSIGVGVGLAVNLLVWPPLRDRAAWSQAEHLPHEIAATLRAMAEGVGPDLESSDVDAWVKGFRRTDVHIDQAWRLLWQAKESGRMNPRRSQPTGVEELKRLLHLLEQAVADGLSMARTMALSAEHDSLWQDAFRTRWVDLTCQIADAVDGRDREALQRLRGDLDDFGREISEDDLRANPWEEYGGLMSNLRNVLESLTGVVEADLVAEAATRRTKRSMDPSELIAAQREQRARGRRFAGRGDGYRE